MIAPRYRTDAMACSCKGFWFRRSCKHIIAYRGALALVLAQNAVNLTWDTARGASGAVRGSQGVTDIGDSPQAATVAAWGSSHEHFNRKQFPVEPNTSLSWKNRGSLPSAYPP